LSTKTFNTEIAQQMLGETREEVARADQKVATLLASLGVAIALIANALLDEEGWSPRALDRYWEVVWWLSAGAAGLAVGCLGFALWPRITRARSQGPSLTYFNDVALVHDVEHVRKALQELESDERTLHQLVALSIITRRKYIWLRRGMGAAAVAVVLGVLSAAVG
jgi:hypothetical protein